MSYTLSNSFKYAAKSQSVQPDWAMKLYYYDGNDSTNFIGISSKDRIIESVKYYGIVTNWSSVVKTIDVANSKAQLASFTIECVNVWKTDTFSALLYGDATNYFINNKALLYMGDDAETTLANWILVGEYRLVNVGHDAQTVTLEFEERTPWDKLKLPKERSANYKRIYYPLVYGNFTEETSTPASPQFCDSAVCWPLPINFIYYEDVRCLAYEPINTSVDVKLHYWHPSLEVYVPLDETNATADDSSTPDDDGRYVIGPGDLRHGVKFYPLGEGNTNDWANPTSCLNENNLNYAQKDINGASGSTNYYFLGLQLPSIDFFAHKITVRLQWDLEVTNSGSTFEVGLYDVTFNSDTTTPEIDDSSSVAIDLGGSGSGGGWTTADGDKSFTGGEPTYTWNSVNYSLEGANYYGANEEWPTELRLCFKVAASNGGASVDAHIRIYTLTVEYTGALTSDNTLKAFDRATSYKSLDVKYMYSGIDGPVNAWDSSAITEPQQMHREILQTHVGLSADDIDTTAWGNLDTAKDGWTARLWELEPVPIKEILERLQFEGGFVAFWSQQDVKYVWVKNDPSGDSEGTLTEDDYKDLNISLTPWDEVITKRIYNYTRHAAKDTLEDSVTWPSSDLRTQYNVATNEDIEEVDLRYLVDEITGGTNPNDHIGRYYDNILNEPKILVNFRIVNPLYFNLEVGDIFQLSDSKIDPFDKTWSNLYFMITEERRQVQQLEIVGRLVYESA